MSKRKSLHIGLNHVDPQQYGGWDGELAGCINDTDAMEAVAKSRGFTTDRLVDSAATIDAVHKKLKALAGELVAGDFFFLTYSGHGGQVPDDDGLADEDDGYDETWCLYDTELVDDTLYGALRTFKPGVRIFVMSDSCHSETVTRGLLRTTRDHRRAFVDRRPGPNSKRAPLEFTEKEYAQNLDRYKEQKTWWTQRTTPGLCDASVVLLSGCADAQTSMDGPGNGAFTYAFLQVWKDGDYHKDYRQLRTDVQAALDSPDQTPGLFWYGTDFESMLSEEPLSDEKAPLANVR